MSAEIIQFGQFRPCRAATGPGTFQGVRLPKDRFLDDAEMNELNSIFPGSCKPATRQALYNEAVEQAYIEMNNGPVDLSALPAIGDMTFKDADRAIKVRQLKLAVERTAQLLREYLEAFRSVR